MRKLCLLILVALLFDIFALHPVSISTHYAGHAAVVALDVCHAPGNGLADHNDVPYETGKPLTAMPYQFLQHSDSFSRGRNREVTNVTTTSWLGQNS